MLLLVSDVEHSINQMNSNTVRRQNVEEMAQGKTTKRVLLLKCPTCKYILRLLFFTLFLSPFVRSDVKAKDICDHWAVCFQLFFPSFFIFIYDLLPSIILTLAIRINCSMQIASDHASRCVHVSKSEYSQILKQQCT